MGFFFAEQTRKKQTKKRRNLSALEGIGCAACPLNHAKVNTPKMSPTLVDDTDIFFLGEAPGKHEDEVSGKPFTGPSGSLLRYVIDNYDLNYSFDNTIRDRPDNNRDPTIVELECCRGLVTKAIEQAKPKVIVGLGKWPLVWMLHTEDQFGLRGRIFAVKVGSHACWFIPTYHPARIIHAENDASKRQKRKPKKTNEHLITTFLGRTFKWDLEIAIKQVEQPPPDIEAPGELRTKVTALTDFDTICAYLRKTKLAPEKAVDIETTNLRPYSRGSAIATIAFSCGDLNYSFPLDHPVCEWNGTQRAELLRLIKDILIDDTIKIGHNAPFEIEWFVFYFGKDVVNHVAWECTQLQSHVLDERRGAGQSNDDDSKHATYQSLDFLVKMYFGINFKALFNVDRKRIVAAPLNETLFYNATDTRLTLKVWARQNDLLRIRGLYSAYQAALIRQPTVALMQHLGMPLNQITVKKLQRKLEDEIAVIKAEIDDVAVVQQYKKDHGKFDPGGDDAMVLFKDYLKRPEVHVEGRNKKGLSLDKHVLEQIDHPLAKLVVRLRNKSKMKSTYVDGLELGPGELVYPDNHLHTSFNTTFTTTARFSSSNPNMQNFPSRADSWIREQIEAYEDHIIVAADFGQLEMCGAAMCSGDTNLVKVLWDDYDTHLDWATRLADIYPAAVPGDFGDNKVKKAFRGLVKNKLVFPALYGAANKSIAGYLGIDVAYIDKLMDGKGGFWDQFAGVKEWQERLLRHYRKTGYVEAPNGRRRHHPLTTNEAINAPIQCIASEIVVEAMCKLSYIAASERKWYLHPRLNIHDEIVWIMPLKGIEKSIEIAYKTMLTPDLMNLIPEKSRVPLSVSVKIGKNWFEMEEIDKYWSHKDVYKT